MKYKVTVRKYFDTYFEGKMEEEIFEDKEKAREFKLSCQEKYKDGCYVKYEIEIIEEPKEELEELEEIEFAKAGDVTIIIINNLIRNQNMIIRELKANK